MEGFYFETRFEHLTSSQCGSKQELVGGANQETLMHAIKFRPITRKTCFVHFHVFLCSSNCLLRNPENTVRLKAARLNKETLNI